MTTIQLIMCQEDEIIIPGFGDTIITLTMSTLEGLESLAVPKFSKRETTGLFSSSLRTIIPKFQEVANITTPNFRFFHEIQKIDVSDTPSNVQYWTDLLYTLRKEGRTSPTEVERSRLTNPEETFSQCVQAFIWGRFVNELLLVRLMMNRDLYDKVWAIIEEREKDDPLVGLEIVKV